jgi:uncharacterized protein YjlB
MQHEIYFLEDDGCVPNNAALPLILIADAFGPGTGTETVITCFARNGWRGAWVNGIYDFHHYHARSHEVLANLGAPVTVQFGGERGPIVEFARGAVAIIPAGGGHCRLSSSEGLVIVGAYPAGQEACDLKRGDDSAVYEIAKREITKVPLPKLDPVLGACGPLIERWHV